MSEFFVMRTSPYQDNHLSVELLAQNGHCYHVLCIGGQGSKKRQTGQKLEMGQCIEISSFHADSQHRFFTLKEFENIWTPKNIRKAYRAWIVMNFISELVLKVFAHQDLNAEEAKHVVKLEEKNKDYQVVAKFMQLMEYLAGLPSAKADYQLTSLLFMSKLTLLQGVNPDLSRCQSCQTLLSVENVASFHSPNFYCGDCVASQLTAKSFWEYFAWATQVKFEDVINLPLREKHVSDRQYQLFSSEIFYLLNINTQQIKSFPLISN